MAIGTMTAIGLGLGAVGAFAGAKSKSKAAKTAANAQAATTQQNNALAANIYGQNQAALSPFMQRGNAAGDQLNAFLGLGGQPQMQQQPELQSYYSGPNPGAYPLGSRPGSQSPAVAYKNALLGAQPLEEFAGAAPPGQQTGINGPLPQSQQPAADPFKQFIANSDYAFQFGEGANKVNSGYAGAGTLRSGAAMKGLEQFRQNLQSGYRGEFTNLLANQQGVGLSGASALAGVGQNYAGMVTANNQNAGDAAANAALVRGANNPFANTLSLLGGGLFGYGR